MTPATSVAKGQKCVNSQSNIKRKNRKNRENLCTHHKRRPHYERYFYSDPERKFPIQTYNRKSDLIRTALICPSTEAKIIYMIQADCDFDKVLNEKFIIDGKVAWKPIYIYLKQHHPYLLDYIFSVTRSYGGRGLSIGFSISPMKLEDNSYSSQRAAKGLLKKIYEALELAGCGIDKGAFGLNRLCANWQNKQNSLYFKPEIKNSIERSREPVLSILLRKMNKDPLLCYKRKKDQLDELLWHHKTTEKGLALLFNELVENDYTLQASTKELKDLTTLSEATLRSVLKKPPKWLKSIWISKSEGWSLALPKSEMLKYTARVWSVLKESNKTKRTQNNFNIVPLKRPEDIEPGERNLQLTNYLLRLKWIGTEYNKALSHTISLSSRIPYQNGSRNLGESRIRAKAQCIYFSSTHQSTFGIKPINQDYPEWLTQGHSPLFPSGTKKVKKNLEAPWRVEKALKSLEEKTQDKVYRKVSLDRHFKWKTQTRINKKGKKVTDYCYYSVPHKPRKGVLVISLGELLKVFDADTGSFLCQHERHRYEPNKYFTQNKHMEGLKLEWFIDLLGKEYPEKKRRWTALYKTGSWRTYRKILKEKREIDLCRKMEGSENG